ncbi:MAG: LamG-like jellyroll fold domain-containing protein, partial [Cyanobacteria bacterium J06638_38]
MAWVKLSTVMAPVFTASTIPATGSWQLQAGEEGIQFQGEDTTLTVTQPGLVAGDWMHIAVAYNATDYVTTLYINGFQAKIQKDVSLNLVSELPLVLGSETFDGSISSWSVAQKALSAAEILEQYKDDLSFSTPCFDLDIDSKNKRVTYKPLANLPDAENPNLPTPVRDPWLGACLDFYGQSQSTTLVNPRLLLPAIGDDESLNRAFTLSLWVKPKTQTGVILGVGDAKANGWTISAASGIQIAGLETIPPNLTIEAWTHLAISYDGSQTLTYYLNGKALETTQKKENYDWWTDLPTLLCLGGEQGKYFHGRLGSITVDRNAKTAADIQKDIKTSIPTFLTAPILNIAPTPYLLEGEKTYLVNQSPRLPNIEIDPATAPKLVQTDVVGKALDFAEPAKPIIWQENNLRELLIGENNQMSSFTLETWVKIPDTNALQIPISIGKDWTLAIKSQNCSLNINNEPLVTTSEQLSPETWNHIALSYDYLTTTLELYINGRLSSDSISVPKGIQWKPEQLFNFGCGGKQRILLRNKEQSGSIMCLAISLDGQTIVSGSRDSKVKVWQKDKDGVLVATELYSDPNNESSTAHTELLYSVSITADGQTIVSGGGDR